LKRFFVFESRIYAIQHIQLFVSLRPVDFHVLFIRQVLCSVPLEGCISLSKFSQSIGLKLYETQFLCLAPFGGMLVLQLSAANASVNTLLKLTWKTNQYSSISPYPTFLEVKQS